MSIQPVFISGEWREAHSVGTFSSENPTTKEALPASFPVSGWEDCNEALDAATIAFSAMRKLRGKDIAEFLETYANLIESRANELVEVANLETALPSAPRLEEVELPRTTGQLRLAAAAARSSNWTQPVIDSANHIRSCYGPIGPVAVFGPNNFPFAFGSASGGDFASAIAAGNPVIAKANSSHPGTTQIFAECASSAASDTGMPPAILQLIYRTKHDIGERLVSDPRIAATGYTGSRNAGLALKRAADRAGKPIYLELSSVNPVIFLPEVLAERTEDLATEFTTSCLMGTGQFCTNPGMVIVIEGSPAETFLELVAQKFSEARDGTLLSASVASSLHESHSILTRAGAEVCVGTGEGSGAGYCASNTVLRVTGQQFLAKPEIMQTEAFGNSTLFVIAKSLREATEVLSQLEGNLTGCIYSSENGLDDEAYNTLSPVLRQKVGRLLNDKMPTGVAVSPAMNHGGPYPVTGHPGFTAVGIPGALLRFAMLQCYDNVRQNRLPEILRDDYTGQAQRLIDGVWT